MAVAMISWSTEGAGKERGVRSINDEVFVQTSKQDERAKRKTQSINELNTSTNCSFGITTIGPSLGLTLGLGLSQKISLYIDLGAGHASENAC